MNIVDNAIALRILYLLVLPFKEWKAYDEGIIDETGKFLVRDSDSENWTMLHRLIARLKIMLGKLPGGKSQLASIGAAYLLVRECYERETEPENVEALFEQVLEFDQIMTLDTYNFVTDTLSNIFEEGEAPANSVVNVAGIKPGEEPPGKIKKKKIIKRELINTQQ